MRYTVSIILLFFSVAAFGQLDQFRMVGSGSWSVVDDSTYSATVTFASDLTANSFLPTGVVDSMRVFTQRGQLYTIDSVGAKTFSTAVIYAVEYGGNWGSPSGQVLVYETRGRETVPAIPFATNGATSKLQEAVVTHNAAINNGVSTTQLADSTTAAKNYTNNQIASVAPVKDTIVQASHGFSVGDPIWYSGDYLLSLDTGLTVRVDGIVSEVPDVNTFVLQKTGRFTLTSHGFTVGVQLYVQPDGSYSVTDTTNTLIYGYPLDANTIQIGLKDDQVGIIAEKFNSVFSGLPDSKSQALDTLSKMQSINSVSSLIAQSDRFKTGQRIVVQETGAIYNVVSSTVATVDNYSVIQNSNGDYLELQRETATDPKYFGATPNDDTEDTQYFNRMIAFQKAKYNAVDIKIQLGDTFLVNMLLVDSIAEFKLHGGGVLKLPAKEYGLDSISILRLDYIPVVNINNIHFDGSKSDPGFIYDRVMPSISYLSRNNLIEIIYNEIGDQKGNSRLIISDFTIKDAFQNCIRIASASDPYLTAKGYANIVVEKFSLINCGGISSRGNPVNFIVRDGYQEADTSSYFIYGAGVLDAEATANSINHTAEAVLTTPITNVLIENIVFKNGEHSIFLQNPNHFTLKNIKSINRGYVVLADTLAPRDTFLVNQHGVSYPGGYIIKVDHVNYKEGRTAYVTGLFQENPEPQGLNGSFNFVECDYNVIVSDFKVNRRFHIRKEDPGQGVSPKQFKVSDGFFFADKLVGAFNNSVAPGSVFDNVSFVPIINDTLANDYGLYKIGLGGVQTLQPSRDVKFVNCDFINAGFNIVNTVDSIQWVDCRFYNEKGIQFNHNQDRFQKGFIIDGCENVRLRQYRFADTTGISGSELTFDPLDSLELTIRNSSLYAWGATSASLTNASELGLYTNSPYIRMQDVTLVDQNYNTIGNIDDRNSTYWPIRRTNSSFEIRPELGVYSELSTGVQTITLDTALLYNPEREVIIKDIAGNLDETNYIQVVAESGVISGPGVVNDTIFMRIPYQWIKLKNTDGNWLIVDGNNSFEKLSINDDGSAYNAITTGKTLNQSTVTIKSDANNSSNSAFRVVNSSNLVLMDLSADGRLAIKSGGFVFAVDQSNLSLTNGVSIQPLSISASTITAQFSQFRGSSGSASSPTWSFSSDTNSGLFSKGQDSVGLSIGGTERLSFFTDKIKLNQYGSSVSQTLSSLGKSIGSYPYPIIASDGTLSNQQSLLDSDGDAGTAGQLFTSTGSGTNWASPSYGEVYIDYIDPDSVTIVTAGTLYDFTDVTEGSSSSDVTVSTTTGRITYTGTTEKLFEITWTASITSDAINENLIGAVTDNGSTITRIRWEEEDTAAGDRHSVSASGFFSMSQNDWVQPKLTSETNGTEVRVITMSFRIQEVR